MGEFVHGAQALADHLLIDAGSSHDAYDASMCLRSDAPDVKISDASTVSTIQQFTNLGRDMLIGRVEEH